MLAHFICLDIDVILVQHSVNNCNNNITLSV